MLDDSQVGGLKAMWSGKLSDSYVRSYKTADYVCKSNIKLKVGIIGVDGTSNQA